MLITSRLLFRPFVLADLDQLHCEIYHNPEVAGMLSPNGTISRQQTAQLLYQRLKHWQLYGFGAWALEYKANHELVGHCGLHYLHNANSKIESEVELTYTIKPTYWGQGLATEAARAVLQWGFETLNLRQIVAVTSPSNRASQRVMDKLGMTYIKRIEYNQTEV